MIALTKISNLTDAKGTDQFRLETTRGMIQKVGTMLKQE